MLIIWLVLFKFICVYMHFKVFDEFLECDNLLSSSSYSDDCTLWKTVEKNKL